MALREYIGTLFGSEKKKPKTALKKGERAQRASTLIKPQARRDVAFQFKHIKSALAAAENPANPDRKLLLDIYRYIMRDGHLSSQMKVALFKVKSEPWMLYKDGKEDEATTLLFRKRWFSLIIQYALEAEFWGYSLVEIDGLDPANSNVGEVTLIERDFVSPEKQWLLIDGSINGAILDYSEIKQELDLLEFGDKKALGCLLECSYNILWKFFARSDWSRLGEKFGTPLLAIEADTNDEEALDQLEEYAANFGTDNYFIGQKGDKVTIVERNAQNGHLIFKDKVVMCNEEVSKIVNGQTATSDQKAYVGAAQVQNETMDDFTTARLQGIVDEVSENVMPYLIYKGFKLDGYSFDYPSLKRAREAKLKGKVSDKTTEVSVKK